LPRGGRVQDGCGGHTAVRLGDRGEPALALIELQEPVVQRAATGHKGTQCQAT
jgi:hypothetical protein